MRLFLFISVDYVAKYAGDGIFFDEKHLFGGFCQTEYLRKTSRIVRRNIFYRIHRFFYVNIFPDVFRLQIFREFLFQEFGSPSSGQENIFQEKLFGNIGHSDEYRFEKQRKKRIENFPVFLVSLIDMGDVVLDIEIPEFWFFPLELLFQKPESEIEGVSSENFSPILDDYRRF